MLGGRLYATTVQNQRKKSPGVTSVSDVKLLHAWVCAKSLQLCPTLCDPVDCSPPSSSVNGILQARILDWVAMPSSRESSWLKDQTRSLALEANSLPSEPLGESSSFLRGNIYIAAWGISFWSVVLTLSALLGTPWVVLLTFMWLILFLSLIHTDAADDLS